MKKLYYLIILTVILGLVLTGCFLSNVGQVPTTEQKNPDGLTPGESVEGLGVFLPDLNIDAIGGNAVLIMQLVPPKAYGAPNDTPGFPTNGCLGDGVKGFATIDLTTDYEFTFTDGMTVNSFSIRMLDYGDYNPTHNTYHYVALIAYDKDGEVVRDELSFNTPGVGNPKSSSNPNYGNLWYTGDACTANLDGSTDPGNHIFTVNASGIVRVELQFGDGADPKIGFKEVSFTPECKTDLVVGRKHEFAGTVTVTNDGTNLLIIYETIDPWLMDETHLHIASDPNDFPQKNGNPIPGKFDYKHENLGGVSVDTYTFPLEHFCDSALNFAAHAAIYRIDEICIDFEEYEEYDDVSKVITPNGDVNFYMTSSFPLEGLLVGGSVALSPSGSYPTIAEEDTKTSPNDFTKIVAFTVNDEKFGGTDSIRDDYVRDASGTGAGGKLLTDPLDKSQDELMWHAYSQYLAIVVDISAIEKIQSLKLAGIDLDHGEVWYFKYFDENNVLIHEEVLGPIGDNSGDGKAFPIEYSDPAISKVAIWGTMNLEEREVVGYAIDNICITLQEEETAWGEGTDFYGKNWAMYFECFVPCL